LYRNAEFGFFMRYFLYSAIQVVKNYQVSDISRFQVSGVRCQVSGSKVQDSWYKAWGMEQRAWGKGLKIQGPKLRVWCLMLNSSIPESLNSSILLPASADT
jgi:hypothetical protein